MNVGHPIWSSTTFSSSRFRREPQDRRREARTAGTEQPRGPHDRVALGRFRRHLALAGQLRAAVRGHRPDHVGFHVRRSLGRRRTRSRSRRGSSMRRTRAAARATLPAPAPFTDWAPSSSRSAPSTSVHAAQLITTSARRRRIASVTAVPSAMSSSARASASTSWPAPLAAAVRSCPSIPAAPVITNCIGARVDGCAMMPP